MRVAPTELKLTGIGAQPLVCLAAEQLIDRRAQGFAANVPQSDIDRAHARVEDVSAAHAPKRCAEQVFPDRFDLHRIFADDARGQVAHDADARLCARAIGQADFADAADSFIGIDTDKDRIEARHARIGSADFTIEYFDVRYFHLSIFQRDFDGARCDDVKRSRFAPTDRPSVSGEECSS